MSETKEIEEIERMSLEMLKEVFYELFPLQNKEQIERRNQIYKVFAVSIVWHGRRITKESCTKDQMALSIKFIDFMLSEYKQYCIAYKLEFVVENYAIDINAQLQHFVKSKLFDKTRHKTFDLSDLFEAMKIE